MTTLLLALVIAGGPRAEEAVEQLRVQTVSDKSKHEASLDAIEKAVKARLPACPRCVTCPDPSSAPVVIAPTVPSSSLLPASTPTPQKPKVPLWVWIVGTAIMATITTGIIVGVASK